MSEGPHRDRSTSVCVCVHLQDEDEVVDAFPALVKVVLRRALVVVVEFEFLDDVRVSEDPQQDFLCDLERAEQADLWWEDQDGEEVGERGSKTQTGTLRWTEVNLGLQGAQASPRAAHL